jgi:thiol:disulfide interchange protein DsbC
MKLAVSILCTTLVALAPAWLSAQPATASAPAAPAAPAAAPAQAAPSQAVMDGIRTALTTRLKPGTSIDAIRNGPLPGLYEIQVGTDIIYVNENVSLLFQGQVFNLETGRNLTRDRIDSVLSAKEATVMPTLWAEAALGDAVKLVKGNGTRKVVVFEDPYCGYCKKLRQSFAEMDDITVYTFMVATLSPDSPNKARDLWCSADRTKAYDDWMVRGKAPAAATATCTDPTKRVADLAKKLGVGPVPHVVFADGSKNVGYLGAPDLTTRLAGVKPVF